MAALFLGTPIATTVTMFQSKESSKTGTDT
jgi:hypothetical protein